MLRIEGTGDTLAEELLSMLFLSPADLSEHWVVSQTSAADVMSP